MAMVSRSSPTAPRVLHRAELVVERHQEALGRLDREPVAQLQQVTVSGDQNGRRLFGESKQVVVSRIGRVVQPRLWIRDELSRAPENSDEALAVTGRDPGPQLG